MAFCLSTSAGVGRFWSSDGNLCMARAASQSDDSGAANNWSCRETRWICTGDRRRPSECAAQQRVKMLLLPVALFSLSMRPYLPSLALPCSTLPPVSFLVVLRYPLPAKPAA